MREEDYHHDPPLAHTSQVYSFGNCVMTLSNESVLTNAKMVLLDRLVCSA
jgi:hypothetical protein